VALEIVSAAVSAIPYACGPLAAIATRIIQNRQNRRLGEFLLSLAEETQRLGARVNEEFMRSEKVQDLFEDVVSRAAETRQQTKLDALRAVFVNTISSGQPKFDEASEIVALLESLQERHVILLRVLAYPTRALEEMPGTEIKVRTTTSPMRVVCELLPRWDEEHILRTWQDLFDRRILRLSWLNPEMTEMMPLSEVIWKLEGTSYAPTSLGRTVVRYISRPI
jgi:hypothetical protein